MQPHRWKPPIADARARAARSDPPLPPVRRLELPGHGPEDVVRRADGWLVTGLADGRLVAVDPESGEVQRLADTGGRPLGLEFAPDGALLICDAERGLLRLAAGNAQPEVLVAEVDGAPLVFASNVVAGTDGTIYFSNSSQRWPFSRWMGDILEHSGTGRVLCRRPDGRVETLLDDLQFANGLVLAPDESCLLVAETGAYRVTRVWLSGPRAGEREPVIENLPGCPDNMSLGSDGLVWIACITPRNPLLDRLLPLPGGLRRLVWALPDALRPAPAKTTWVMAVDFDGRVVHDLQNDGPEYSMVTGLVEHSGTLYLGSLTESALGVSRIP
jgi:sugar lactone lactonase YvrE